MEFLWAPFLEFEFMRRALLGCLALSLSAAPVGAFLLLRRMALTGDAMSHAILPGAALGYLVAGLSVGAMTLGGLIAGVLVAVLSGWVTRQTRTTEDSNLAAFYLISLASGVMIVSLRGSSVDLLHVLFGSALGLDDEALALLLGVMALTMAGVVILYRAWILECLDPGFLRSVAPRWSPIAHYGLLILIVLNLVAGFHALGSLMSVGLMILPAASSRFWTRRLEPLLVLSAAFAVAACLAGLLLSYYVSLPTSPLIILCLGAIYLASLLFGASRGWMTRAWIDRQRHRVA